MCEQPWVYLCSSLVSRCSQRLWPMFRTGDSPEICHLVPSLYKGRDRGPEKIRDERSPVASSRPRKNKPQSSHVPSRLWVRPGIWADVKPGQAPHHPFGKSRFQLGVPGGPPGLFAAVAGPAHWSPGHRGTGSYRFSA